MKLTFTSPIAFTAIALMPLISSANTGDKYPAANFEPTVIYVDKEVVNSSTSSSEFDAKYPAANFSPKVVYIDNDLVEQMENKTDPKYPAAYFKPKVIFP